MLRGICARIALVSVLTSPLIAAAEDTSLTIYNQNFAVVREGVHIDLQHGVNDFEFAGATAMLEPDSVILRDPTTRRNFQILEQNYRNDPVSQGLLLTLFEGQTIDFLVDKDKTVRGRIVRGGQRIMQQQWTPDGTVRMVPVIVGEPIIEVDGKLRFSLPGTPLFPALGEDTILKPTLSWRIETDRDGPLDAELAYVTGGLSWNADYNVVAPETGDVLDVIGWVTMNNNSGTAFREANVSLMAGDVNKIKPQSEYQRYAGGMATRGLAAEDMSQPVTERSFDEYHLYTLSHRATLRDGEMKQVEFVRGEGVKSETLYVYDGASDGPWYHWWLYGRKNNDRNYGAQSNPKVWIMRQFMNAEDNGLGIPLPAGRVRFYRRDVDDRLQFIGENEIDHTPKDERVRVYTGNAFDLVGERKQTDFKYDSAARTIDETFEIRLRNHKQEAVEIRAVEHLFRYANWQIRNASSDAIKTDAFTAEFRERVEPDEEVVITYTAHYWW